MLADNTRYLQQAAQRRREETRRRAEQTLAQVTVDGTAITVGLFCRQARVSRSWLYTQPDLITALQQLDSPGSRPVVPAPQRASERSTRRRLELALARNRELTEEVRHLRTQLAAALGQQRAQRSDEHPLRAR